MNLKEQLHHLQQQQQQLINERGAINEQLDSLAPFQARLKVCERELANVNGALAIVQQLLKEQDAAEQPASAPLDPKAKKASK